MGRSNQDVGGYRGRRTITDILKFIAIALAVIVVLVLAGVFYLQRYVVYTDEGVKLELPPFLQVFRQEGKEPAGAVPLPDPGDVSVVVEPDGSGSEPEPEPKAGADYALALPVEDVLNGTAAARLEQAGAGALILEVKDAGGRLAWYSEDYTAQWSEVCGPETANAALRQWNGGDVYTIARMCCFRDDKAPYSRNKLALRKGDFNWRDELGLRWLSPAQEDAQEYIANLCAELGALGFDEIVLEQWHFPVGGNTDTITRGEKYNPAAFTAGLETLLTRVQAAVEPYGTKISLRVEKAALENPDLSGLSLELLDRFGYRFWTDQEGWLWLSTLDNDIPQRVVEIVPQADEEKTQFYAVIPPEE